MLNFFEKVKPFNLFIMYSSLINNDLQIMSYTMLQFHEENLLIGKRILLILTSWPLDPWPVPVIWFADGFERWLQPAK